MSRSVNVNEVFDNIPFSPYQTAVCLLCFCIVFLDGFDLTVIGVALPKIAEHLNAKPSELGLALSAGQLGPMIGAVLLGMLADRVGRKKTMFCSAIVFGFFTYMTTHITSVEELAAYRFLAGLGMGGAIPNALAFGTEYAPARIRTSLSLYMWAGMPCGAMIAGFAASWLLPHYGWQSVFIVGGIAPVIIAFLVLALLPDSLHHLVRTGTAKSLAKAREILARIDTSSPLSADIELTVTSQTKEKGGSLKSLFTDNRLLTTILLWILFYMSFYLLWILFSWVPTLLKKSGASVQQYSIGFAFIHLGSVVAILCIGRCMDKYNKLNVVKYVFLAAFFAMLAFGYFSSGYPFAVVIVVSVLAGLFVNGGNSALMGLASAVYPAEIRATGIGWAYGIGKIGSFLAPAIGGFYLARNWSVFDICAVNGSSALIIAIVVVILQRHMRSTARGEV
ncbi:MFS transporter [Trichlorobacter lovleyi]|uniref:MFS transporter n=1 Tax=Trichlorobacter lovleyi TaxID=313985 RepID=UPI0023F215C6|nr:MFS transporter [Trichlorobacter lovleyi]